MPLDQTMLESTGSGVAQPLSPPPTEYHMPRGMGRRPPPRTACEPAVARSARRGSVLAVAVDEVGNAVVDRDVVHLRDREVDVVPASCRG